MERREEREEKKKEKSKNDIKILLNL